MKKFVSLLVTGAALYCFSGVAQAKGVPLVYQTGEDIFVAGDGSLPPEFADSPDLVGYQSGYRCDVFGILWAYVSVSECKPVVFKDDTYAEDAELSAAVMKLHPESEINMGFWAGYGKFPLGLIILGGLGSAAWGFFSKDDEQEEGETPAAT